MDRDRSIRSAPGKRNVVGEPKKKKKFGGTESELATGLVTEIRRGKNREKKKHGEGGEGALGMYIKCPGKNGGTERG